MFIVYWVVGAVAQQSDVLPVCAHTDAQMSMNVSDLLMNLSLWHDMMAALYPQLMLCCGWLKIPYVFRFDISMDWPRQVGWFLLLSIILYRTRRVWASFQWAVSPRAYWSWTPLKNEIVRADIDSSSVEFLHWRGARRKETGMETWRAISCACEVHGM